MSAAPRLMVLSAGAAKGVVDALEPQFRETTGTSIAGTFGAVGAIRERFLAGDACDLLILTEAMLDALARDGHIVPDTRAPLGEVPTGVAVRRGDPQPRIDDAQSLRASLAQANAWYCPDPERATAGIHFLKVLRELGLGADAATRLRAYPSGAIAMHELAQCTQTGALGCTQITEILYTPGVDLVGVLPAPFALATPYGVAVSGRAREPDLARRLARMLTDVTAQKLRERGGFVVAAGC